MTTQPTMTPAAFAQKWQGRTATETAASQEHFIDLCRMLGEPTPNEADPTGEHFAFEKRVVKGGGGDGFADVWKRGFFAWEYKGKRADLKAAYKQLLDYREDLENPPLLIVSDIERIEIHTNFPWLTPKVLTVTIEDLRVRNPTDAMNILKSAMGAPADFRPRKPVWTSRSTHAQAFEPSSGEATLDPQAPIARSTTTPTRRAGGYRSSEAVRANEAELDRRWQLKKDRTREERERLNKAIAAARALRSGTLAKRLAHSTLAKAGPRDRAPAIGTRSSAVIPSAPVSLKPTSPNPRQARPEPVAGGPDVRCPHGMSKANCAHCHPGRYLPPIKIRR